MNELLSYIREERVKREVGAIWQTPKGWSAKRADRTEGGFPDRESAKAWLSGKGKPPGQKGPTQSKKDGAAELPPEVTTGLTRGPGSSTATGLMVGRGEKPSISQISARAVSRVDSDLFAYAGRGGKFRAKNFARLGVIAKDPELSEEQRQRASEMESELSEFLGSYNEYQSATGRRRQQLEKELQKQASDLQEKYKLFSNKSGTSFKTLDFGMRRRHIFGEGSGLSRDLVNAFGELGVDLKNSAEGDGVLKDTLGSASKPNLGSSVSANPTKGKGRGAPTIPGDETARSIFDGLAAAGVDIPGAYQQLYGPTEGDPPRLIRSGGENAEIHFRHSVENNKSLERTETALREAGMDKMADAVSAHRNRMKKIADNFPNMSPEEREKAVQQSYAEMALALSNPAMGGDRELAGTIMKNLAEVNLFDQEIVAGVEVYLPSHGSFPGADKLVVEKDEVFGERVSGISVKFGKSGAVYGMRAQSSTITLFHPDKFYHGITSGRPGEDGYELGARADCLETGTWSRLADESGYSEVYSSQELEDLRKLNEAAARDISRARGTTKGWEASERAFEATQERRRKKAQELIFGKKGEKRAALVDKLSEERVRILERDPLAFTSMMSVDAAIISGNGFPSLRHCTQDIADTDGVVDYAQQVKKGTPDLECWRPAWRSTGKRAGGLLISYNCPKEQGGN